MFSKLLVPIYGSDNSLCSESKNILDKSKGVGNKKWRKG